MGLADSDGDCVSTLSLPSHGSPSSMGSPQSYGGGAMDISCVHWGLLDTCPLTDGPTVWWGHLSQPHLDLLWGWPRPPVTLQCPAAQLHLPLPRKVQANFVSQPCDLNHGGGEGSKWQRGDKHRGLFPSHRLTWISNKFLPAMAPLFPLPLTVGLQCLLLALTREPGGSAQRWGARMVHFRRNSLPARGGHS